MRFSNIVLSLCLTAFAVSCTGAEETGPLFSQTWEAGDHVLVATAYTEAPSTEVVLESAGPGDYFAQVTVVDGTADGDLDGFLNRLDDRVYSLAVTGLAAEWQYGSDGERVLIEAIGNSLEIDPDLINRPEHAPGLSRNAARDADITIDPDLINRPEHAPGLSRNAARDADITIDPDLINRPEHAPGLSRNAARDADITIDPDLINRPEHAPGLSRNAARDADITIDPDLINRPEHAPGLSRNAARDADITIDPDLINRPEHAPGLSRNPANEADITVDSDVISPDLSRN